MTAPAAPPATPARPWTPRPGPHAPWTIWTAVLVTWLMATLTTAAVVVTALWLLSLGELWDTFEPAPDEAALPDLIAWAAVTLAVAGVVAGVAAFFVLRGHAWAQYVLGALSVACLGGALLVHFILPALVAVAALLVLVLLLTPSARAWPRERRAALARTAAAAA